MSMLKRLSNLIRSNVNDALDKAEDPRKILEQTILDMANEHKNAKKRLLETMTLLKQSERQAENYKKASADWESKAMAALKGGNDELARAALGEKTKSDELVGEAEQGVAQQKAYCEELKSSLSQLEQKINEAKGKRDELLARLSSAEMKKKQAAIQSGEGPRDATKDASAFDTFDRMVEKIENSEAELDARKELYGDTTGPEIERELARLGQESKADDALEALKRKMAEGSSAPAPAPAPSAPPKEASAVDDELAKLRQRLEGGEG
jgi:phage shock protein A